MINFRAGNVFDGLSSDTKPIASENSLFIETNTKKFFLYEGASWTDFNLASLGTGNTQVRNNLELDGRYEPLFSKNTAFNKNFGTISGTVAEGNDSRLSNARTPTAHKSTHAVGGSDALTPADIGALSTTLTSANIFVGSSSNVATARTLSLNATGGTFAVSNTGIVTFPNASTSLRGLLTAADWGTFNSKENALTFSTGLSRTGNTVTNTITQYTDTLARGAISLGTSGSSGAATYNSSTGALNVPNYTLAGLGYTGDLNADNYTSWVLTAFGVTGSQNVTSGNTVEFSGTSPILVDRSVSVGGGGLTNVITYSHATSGVAVATYNNVTVNATGHVTSGTNAPYLTFASLGYSGSATNGTITNTAGDNATIPLVGTNAGLMSPSDKTKLNDIQPIVNLTVETPNTTAAKSSNETVTFEDGVVYMVKFINGTSVANATLNGVNIRLGTTNVSTVTLSTGAAEVVIPMRYNSTTNTLQIFGSHRTSDSTEDANMRWNVSIQVGEAITQRKILMEGVDGRYYPISVGDTTTANTKTISIEEFKINGNILYYGTTTVLSENQTTTTTYSEVSMGSNFARTSNQISGWTNLRAVYLKGNVNSSGNFVLAGAGTTGNDFMTQSLPTSDDGFVYMLFGHMYTTTTSFRLISQHPIYEYKDGKIRKYTPIPPASEFVSGVVTTGTQTFGGVKIFDDDILGENITISGHLAAETKSFKIPHKTKGGYLQYGVVESNEHGVYVRGKTKESVIELPDHWDWLVESESVTVQVTPVGKPMNLWVVKQDHHQIEIGGVEGFYNYTVYGTRKDVAKIEVEIKE
jgi:hypothetical protein